MIYRPAQLRGWAFLGLLLLVLAILIGMIWRNLARVEALRAYVSYSHRIQTASLGMQNALLQHLFDEAGIAPARLRVLGEQVFALIQLDKHLDPDTPRKLSGVRSDLIEAADGHDSPEGLEARLLSATSRMNEALDAETLLRERMLEDLSTDTRYEVALASGTLASLLLFAGVFLRRRILAPLNDLRELLLRIAAEDFSPIDVDRLDPLLVPVFNSYNEMVKHLAELEEAKRLHAESLEAEVRVATRALLEQQRSLAQAERLAAVGELAAGIAHELRNPLAGIQMTCVNLRDETSQPEQAGRLDLVIAELRRMARLLTDLLERGRQTPVAPKDCDLARVLRELVSLTRYQIAAHIRLSCQCPEPLLCRLSECALRQALLNLVLNAAEALNGRAGDIRIRAWRDGQSLYLTVTDDGPGFTEEILSSGIRPFVTGHPRGTGLGLAIVHRFVRDAGGQLKLSNAGPNGACVTLQLPFVPVRENAE